jgi:hypothetical protein
LEAVCSPDLLWMQWQKVSIVHTGRREWTLSAQLVTQELRCHSTLWLGRNSVYSASNSIVVVFFKEKHVCVWFLLRSDITCFCLSIAYRLSSRLCMNWYRNSVMLVQLYLLSLLIFAHSGHFFF